MDETLDGFFEVAPTPMAQLDPELAYVRVNSAYAAVVGEAADALTGRDYLASCPDDKVAEFFRRVCDTGDPRGGGGKPLVYPGHGRDGLSYWDWTLTPLKSAAGRLSSFLLTLRDITEQCRATASEQEARQLLQVVIDAIPQRVYWKDCDSHYLGCNSLVAADLGLARPVDLIGKCDSQLTWPWRQTASDQDVMASSAAKATGEERVTTAEGHQRWLRRSEILIRDAAGEVRGMLGLYEDITECKAAERQLRITQAAIDERERAERDLQLAHTAINKSSTCFYWLSPEGQVLYVNDASCAALGYRREEFVGMHIWDFDPAFTPQAQVQAWEAIKAQRSFTMESYHRRKDGVTFPIEVSANYVAFNQEEYTFCFVQDISKRRRAERDLKLAHTAINKSKSSFYWLSPQGQVIDVNDAAAASLGYRREELIGLYIWDFDPDFPPEANEQAWEALRREGSTVIESRHRRKDGTIFPVEATTNYVCMDGDEYTFTFVQDISERKATEEKIRNLAFFDPLTHLPNRRLLMDRIDQALAASTRSGGYGALMFIDLDNFKCVNDTLGHDVGDLLLLEVAERLRATVRDADTVARLGGDEFVVMLPALSDDRVRAESLVSVIADRALEELHRPYRLHGHERSTSCSIGISLFHGRQERTSDLLSRADAAMYKAKNAGRNTVRFFDPALQKALEARAQLESWLPQALPRGQLLLYYQPQVDQDLQPIGLEALLRWRHPDQGFISPATFIPIAEETGLILPIGQWVAETAIAQLEVWEDTPLLSQLTLSINVSARQFVQPDFVGQIKRALDRSKIDPTRLKLELTESLVLHDVEDTIEKMNQLKRLGLGFSLDDFGTGQSSLTYLKRLPLDQLKIDQSFVRDITTDPNDATLVQAIIGMGHDLRLQVVAEGVETKEQLSLLRRYGCKAFQGYLFGKPIPAMALETSLGIQQTAIAAL